jgi:hypothetical protein
VLVAAGVALVLLVGGGDDTRRGSQTARTQTGESPSANGPRPSLTASNPGGGASATGQTAPTGGGQVVPIDPNGNPPPLDPNAPRITPGEPRGTTAGGVATGTGKSEDYVVGNVRIRDHRGSGQTPLDMPPNIHTPEGPRINSTLTNDIGKQVRTITLACAKDLSREGRGASPRVEGLLVTTVKANQLGVLSATMQPRELPEAATAALRACMEPKIIGLTAPAPDQADLDAYSISMRMTLP